MSNLRLVTTERFGEMDCNFYCNINDDILMSREQIGSALEYKNPDVALSKIHSKHKDRLDNLSVVSKLVSTDGKTYSTILYSRRGVMEICRWSKQPKANAFMDFCWEVMDRLLHNEPINQYQQQDLSPIITAITSLQNEIQLLRYNQQRQQPLKKYSKWKTRTNPKLKRLSDYFGKNQMTILRNIYIELEDIYKLDLSDYQEDYCFDIGLENCSQFDVIEHNKDLKEKFNIIIDSLLVRYGLENEEVFSHKRKTIFDDDYIIENNTLQN